MAPSYQDKTGPAHNQLMLEIGQTNIVTSQLVLCCTYLYLVTDSATFDGGSAVSQA